LNDFEKTFAGTDLEDGVK